MTKMLKFLASTRLTLGGFGILAVALIAKEFAVFSTSWIVLAILVALTLNLAAA